MGNIEKPNYKKFDNESDKPFFAAYLNTAKQNVFIILRNISESIGIGFDLSNDDNMLNADLWKKLESNNEPELTQRIIEKLEKQFPFINYLAKNYAYFNRKERNAIPEYYCKVFEVLIKQLYSYRNFYSHAVHDTVKMDTSIIRGMQILFDSSRREVKKRFALKTKDVEHLVRLSSRRVNGKSETYEKDSFQYRFADNGVITEKGFAFFVCLWLQRKSAQEMLKKLKGFKRSESPSQKATLENYTFYSSRMPQPKLTSDNNKEGLLLDMINELKSCPKGLYQLLSDADREKFKSLDEDKSVALDDEYEAMPILKRSGNRFFYFALRYLDNEFKNIKFHIDLGNYCFHVYDQEIEGVIKKRRWIKRMTGFGNLEDFADTNRPKEWADKIQKLEDRKRDNSNIYLTETTPHYHINENNIGLKIIDKYADLKKENKIWTNLTEFDKDSKLKPNPTKPRNEKPDCWLSLFELPAIVFYQLLQQNNNKCYSAESIISRHRKNIKAFFNDVENGIFPIGLTNDKLIEELERRGLEKSFIPKAIISYLTSKTIEPFDVKAKKKLEEFKLETSKLLGKVKRQKTYFEKKPGSKDYIEMKSGNMADFLARDMIHLQKPVGIQDGKANGTEFQLLQAKLAFFSINKNTLQDTFKLCNLIDTRNSHPFLHTINIQECKGVLDFYIKYLELRLNYFGQCLIDKKYNEYHFLKLGERRRSSGKDYIVKLTKELKEETAMNLPRGLFLKPIIEILASNEETKNLADDFRKMNRVNTAYIIDKYFTSIINDKPQEFYNYKKSYELLNKLFDRRRDYEKRNTIGKQYFGTADLAKKTAKIDGNNQDNEIIRLLPALIQKHIKNNRVFNETEKLRVKNLYWEKYKAFTENEKQIRLAKTCDMVLFMMADNIFRKNFVEDKGIMRKNKNLSPQVSVEIGKGYKLAEIKPNSDEGFLSLQTRVELQLHGKTIVKETIKIKNYGDFRGLMKDRRISSLLPYINDKEIHFEALQKELEIYEKARIDVFTKIYDFEKNTIKKKGLQKSNASYINHKDILKSVINESDDKFNKIFTLRNAFSHSNYPDYNLFKDEINGNGFNKLKNYKKGDEGILNSSVALQFKNIIINYYDELIIQLKKETDIIIN